MRPLFDTNILIDCLKSFPFAKHEIKRYEDGAISIVSWIEVMAGVPVDQDSISRSFLAQFELIPMTSSIAERTVLNRKLTRLKLPDAIILATAQVENCLLITRNTRDFPEAHENIRIPYRL